jgi:alpha/beta superfamily hydrolase
MEYVFELLKNNISLCTFDFSGCGNSEGEYISLGFHEWKDLEEVVKYLKGK